MSEGGGGREELGSVLRELAVEGEASPSLTGAQIRQRGEARGRRRRVVAAATVTVLLVAGAAVAVPRLLGERQPPAGPAVSAPPSPNPSRVARPDGDGAAVAACSEDDLSFSASNEDGEGDPVRHVLLTVINTGEEQCAVYHYPYVQLGADAQTTAPVIEESDPEEFVSLAPGEQAHAALLVAGGAMDEYEADFITLDLQGREPGSNAGEPIIIEVPGVEALFADDGQCVTYWTTASGLALDFIMSR
ncbi:DUF4232 domain-containing protein [Streptomyces sp. 6N223]|uniref:DUF4232 domain-containing protein n=1 Tax=Streptomyces sp. 6N223 TaxID=3457412 RepID=UPI003FD00A55